MPAKKKLVEQPAVDPKSGEVITASPDQVQKVTMFVGINHRMVTVEWFKREATAFATAIMNNPYPRDQRSNTPESRYRDEVEKVVFEELSTLAGDDVETIHFRFQDEPPFEANPA